MKTIWVITFSYDNKSIADNIFFSSYQEAYDWKKDKIAKGECGNPITAYHFKSLSNNQSTQEEIDAVNARLQFLYGDK